MFISANNAKMGLIETKRGLLPGGGRLVLLFTNDLGLFFPIKQTFLSGKHVSSPIIIIFRDS